MSNIFTFYIIWYIIVINNIETLWHKGHYLRNYMEAIILDYIQRAERIAKREFMSAAELCKELDIAHNTLIRIRRNPLSCSMRIIKKIKKFVEDWEKNGN